MSRASEAKTALKALIAQGIDQAIRRLDEILDPASPAYNAFVQLKSRYSLYLSNTLLGMTAPDELNRQYAQISHAFIILTDGLMGSDLKPESGAAAAAPRRGELLYHIPRQMQEKHEYRCAVRVAYLKDLLYQDWETHAGDAQKNIRVAEVMSVELVNLDDDEPFSIRALHNTVQFLDENDYTEWVFLVKPKHSGEFNLALRVSVIEIRDGREVKKDVVLEQHVIVATEATEAVPQFVRSGVHLNFNPSDSGSQTRIPNPQSRRIPSGLRVTALFLAFLMAGTTATWAFTPPPTRDWWLTRYVENDEQAYQAYIEKYKDAGVKQVEDAYFRKAEVNPNLQNLRDYQRAYPQGQFREQVLEKIETLEIKAVESIWQQPDAEKIRQFVRDFPESERLPELKQAAAARAELLLVVEEAYVYSIDAQPTRTKVLAYLLDFPQRERLPEVAEAAASRPEVLREVQPDLENAFLQKMEQNPDAPQAEAFLKRFPVPTQRERFERILEKKPALKKQFLQKMEKAAEEQKAREEEERRRAAEEAAEKARLEELQRRAQEEKDATERARLEKEAAEEAERQRLKKEAEEAERRRLEAEARRDTDSDGLPDKDDLCPDEKGDASNNGCPTIEPPKGKKSGFEMVRVQGGTFTMGEYAHDNCKHSVTVKTFEIGKYEVTQADWREVMGSNPTLLGFPGCDECPVEAVSWDDVQDFIKKLNSKTVQKYRLPTEAEWEYAARGGSKSKGYTYSGGNDLGKVAWCNGNSGSKTHPVGQKAANELGLYDMSGNVSEWCQDPYGPYSCDKETKAEKSIAVFRGGSWVNNDITCRVALRDRADRNNWDVIIGLRLARAASAGGQ